MALTPTVPRHNDSIPTYDGMMVYPCVAANPVNTGDIVIYDLAASSIRTAAVQADMAHYVGIAEQTNPVTSNLDSPGAIGASVSMLVREKGCVYFFATAGDVYDIGTPVFFNEAASVQTVTSVATGRTVAVGVVWPQQQQMVYGSGWKVASAAAGSLVLVRLTPAWPLNANGAHIE